MIQQFIELGKGFGDVFELCELIETNKHRYCNAFILTSEVNGKSVVSLAVAFNAVGDTKFMPLYICREGISHSQTKPSKRVQLFENKISEIGRKVNTLEVKHSSEFAESTLYYQYLIGIMRLHHYIPSMY
ncbi:methylthioribose kinase [Viridibacillus sp. YIM B01967]|uniref:Methylthioribose kinase n=1 Tax=Viridibacillus soli TaxID=2798301 RepID=A0ABS1H7P3_9BACL|nr:methylthioribose kinase [Viridibacillus soli]MBK3495443.1 methylthioribose kinase [Viridibacillus soli]